MMKHFFNTCIKIIKENLTFLIVFFVLLIALTYEFPYYIEIPGGTIDIASRITVEDGYSSKGSFHMAYVSELKATIPTLVMSKIKKDWDVIKKNEVVLENEEATDVYIRDRLMLDEANQTAILVAFQKANKNVQIQKQELYITYIDKIAKTNLKVGDQILEINGNKIETEKEIRDVLQNQKIGDTVSFTVLRKQKKIKAEAELMDYEGRKIIGFTLTEKLELKTDPTVKIHFEASESGPSGGLMMTLAIYNNLIPEDITKGKKIVGTGTIDKEGKVGEIAGIKYKLLGASKAKADIFFVPNGKNYEEALQIKEDRNMKIQIVGVDTIEDVLTYLDKSFH